MINIKNIKTFNFSKIDQINIERFEIKGSFFFNIDKDNDKTVHVILRDKQGLWIMLSFPYFIFTELYIVFENLILEGKNETKGKVLFNMPKTEFNNCNNLKETTEYLKEINNLYENSGNKELIDSILGEFSKPKYLVNEINPNKQ